MIQSSSSLPSANDQQPDLPLGWVAATLGSIVRLPGETVNPATMPTAIYVGLEHIESNTRRLLGTGTAREVKSTKSIFQSGDILYGKLRPYLNKVVRPDFSGICSTDILVLRPEAGVEGEFIERILSGAKFLEFAIASSAGTNLPRSSFNRLAGFKICLPPTSEQRRILDKVREYEAESRGAREAIADVPTMLESVHHSLLSAAVHGTLTKSWRNKNRTVVTGTKLVARVKIEREENTIKLKENIAAQVRTWPFTVPDSWAWAYSSEVVDPNTPIAYGILQPGVKVARGVRYVRGVDIAEGGILADQLLRTTQAIADQHAHLALRAGDVLLSIIRATKVALVPAELAGINITRSIALLRPSIALHPQYLFFALQSPELQRWLHSRLRGVDMPGLNLRDVRKLPIPIPPLSEQRQIARLLLTSSDQLKAAQAAHVAATEEIARLEQTILNQALSGELTAQDATEESASSILANIKIARAIPPKNKSTRRRLLPHSIGQKNMQLIDLIRTRIGSRKFTFKDLRKALADDVGDYEQLKEDFYSLLRSKVHGAQPELIMVFNPQTKSVTYNLS